MLYGTYEAKLTSDDRKIISDALRELDFHLALDENPIYTHQDIQIVLRKIHSMPE
jgi:hypothetical protein